MIGECRGIFFLKILVVLFFLFFFLSSFYIHLYVQINISYGEAELELLSLKKRRRWGELERDFLLASVVIGQGMIIFNRKKIRFD